MKLTVLLCLIAVVNCHVALAKKKGGSWGIFKIKNKNTKPKDDFKSKPNLYNQGGSVHKQDVPGSHGNQRPQQPAPGQGGIGQHPAQGGYPGQGGYPAQGGYAGHGGYINQNPNNPILSPHYGGSYGGYAPGRGSPYSRAVQAMHYVPSEKSKGFGRSAMMSAAGGAVAGMALGYGLGRIPRPHFNFHNPQEEYYYNYYMYKKYGPKSLAFGDFRRDFKTPPENYDQFMSSCMRREDLLPAPKKSKLTTKTPPTTITTTTSKSPPSTFTTTTSTTSTTTSVSSSVSSNMTRPMTANNSTSAVPTTSDFPKPSEASPGAAVAMAVSYRDGHEDDDDTVSVVEIGYPALIEQLKARRCLEQYMVHSAKYLRKTPTQSPRGGGQRWESPHWLLLVLTVTVIVAQ